VSDYEKLQHPQTPLPAPAWAVLNFSSRKSAGISDPEEPEKYNNTKVMYGAISYSYRASFDTCNNSSEV
jgi:hypothetical protein